MSVLQPVCYYSKVVFETGSPGDGGDVSFFVVVKKLMRAEQFLLDALQSP